MRMKKKNPRPPRLHDGAGADDGFTGRMPPLGISDGGALAFADGHVKYF
jgi:prepilin-type processing-associated H-X9-DG protein